MWATVLTDEKQSCGVALGPSEVNICVGLTGEMLLGLKNSCLLQLCHSIVLSFLPFPKVVCLLS